MMRNAGMRQTLAFIAVFTKVGPIGQGWTPCGWSQWTSHATRGDQNDGCWV